MKKLSILLLSFLLCACAPMLQEDYTPTRTSQEVSSKALIELGQARFDEGQFDEAADAFRAALVDTPAGAWGAKARLSLALAENALSHYKQALELALAAAGEPELPASQRTTAYLLAFDLESRLNLNKDVLILGQSLLNSPPVPLSSQQRLQILEKALKACRNLQDGQSAALLVNQVFKTTSSPDAAWLNKFSDLAAQVYPDYAPALKSQWPERDGQLMAEFIWVKYYLKAGPLSEARGISQNLLNTPGLNAAWQEALAITSATLEQAAHGGLPGRVGLIMPLSGSMATYGKPLATAVEMGLGVLNEGGVSLYLEDDGDNPQRAAAAVEKLVNQHQVMVIIGPLGVKSSQAASARAQELGVPIISLSQGRAELLSNREYVFQNYFAPEDQAIALVDALITQRHKYRVAILAPSNSFGKNFAEIMDGILREKGGQTVATSFYTPGTTDFYTIIQELNANYRFDAIFVPDSAERSAGILNAIAEHKLHPIVMGTNLWHSAKLLIGAGSAASGVWFANAYDASVPQSRVPGSFVEDFKHAVGRQPNVLEAQGYDAGLVIRHFMGTLPTPNRTSLAQALQGLNRFPGLCGMLTTKENGKISKPLTVFSVEGGKFVPLFRGPDSF